jgi:hypothetical protein
LEEYDLNTICGIDCSVCSYIKTCGGCIATHGQPFGKDCVIAKCCYDKGQNFCSECPEGSCIFQEKLIEEFNNLGIEDMEVVTKLNALKGSYVNLEYTLPSGQTIRLLDDNKIYIGYQLEKKNSSRCYGIVADEKFLLVCEYGKDGTDAEIVVFKNRT